MPYNGSVRAQTGFVNDVASGTPGITVPSDGWYSVSAMVLLTSINTGVAIPHIEIRDAATSAILIAGEGITVSGNSKLIYLASGLVYLAANTKLQTYLSASGNLIIGGGADNRTNLRVVKMP